MKRIGRLLLEVYVWVVVGAIIVAPFVLWLLPADTFDDGQSLCPSVLLFGVECLGCGTTRAVMHMHHGEWREALYYNYGVVWIYPLLALIWLAVVLKVLEVRGWIHPKRWTSPVGRWIAKVLAKL